MKKKKTLSALKKKIHPFISYAFLFGVGAVAISGTAAYVGPELDNYQPAPTANVLTTGANQNLPKNDWPDDIATLKENSRQFSEQLSIIKNQIDELKKYGRIPPAELMNAIGEGEQLTAIIAKALSYEEIGDFNPAIKLQSIGRRVREYSKF